jgi:hypothetical protein
MAVGVRSDFVGLLGGGIQGDGRIGLVAFGERQFLALSIYRRGRGKNEVPDGMLTRALEKIQKPFVVGFLVRKRGDKGVANTGLGRQMADPGNRMSFEDPFEILKIADIDERELESIVAAKYFQAVFLESRVVVLVEIIEAKYILAPLKQGL